MATRHTYTSLYYLSMTKLRAFLTVLTLYNEFLEFSQGTHAI